MPVKPDYQAPEEKPLEVLPPDYYHCKIEDIEGEVKDFGFKNSDGSLQPPTHQFIIKLVVVSGPLKGRKMMTWVRDSLFPQNKSKSPTLPKLLKAITGKNYTVANRAEVTPDFINSLIGQELRVSTTLEEDKTGQERSRVVAFAALLKPATPETAVEEPSAV